MDPEPTGTALPSQYPSGYPAASPAGGSRFLSGVVGAVVGIVVTASAAGVFFIKTRSSGGGEAAPAFNVSTDTIRLVPSASPLEFDTVVAELAPPLARVPVTARVTTVDALTAPSFAPLDGRVVDVPVKFGDHVQEGDRLVLVASGDLATMQRDLGAARLSIRTKEALVERLKLLVELRAAPKNDLMVAESELSESKLIAAAADAKLRSLKVRQTGDSSYWVLAARTGTVVQLDASRGKQVGPDKDKPVATVADLDEVLVVSDVPQREASSLSPGMGVTIRQPGSGNDPVNGAIDVVSDVLDPERQTVPIRVRVKNPGHVLRPGQFVEATFSVKDERVVQVPSEAVVSDGATSVVFVETERDVLVRRPVRLGRQTKAKAEIVSGVREGERVVVRGALLLLNAVDTKR